MNTTTSLHSSVEGLKAIERQIARLEGKKRIRNLLKKIGFGYFLYRNVEQHLSDLENRKNALLISIRSEMKETIEYHERLRGEIEASHELLPQDQRERWLYLLETFEADLAHLKVSSLVEPNVVSSAMGRTSELRHFVYQYNENLEREQLRKKLLSLEDDVLKSEVELRQLLEREQYLSKKELHSWKEKWNRLDSPIREYVTKGITGMDFQNSILFIHDAYGRGDRLLEERNQEYIEKEIQRSELFKEIDGSILTEEQRRAIVVDEANNLVVAGAGTGKTTVLLGKALYIVSKGLASPNEVLVVAFNDAIVREDEKKLNEQSESKFTVKTYHSLGREIIGKTVGKKPAVASWAIDKLETPSKILGLIRNRMRDGDFARLINEYFLFHFHTYKSIFEFSNLGEYYKYLKDNEVRTLKGHRVKSLEECEIANFLYINGIRYEYEKPYDKRDTSKAERSQYRPDFTLPDYGIYIEHFGIDRKRNTAPWVSREKYLADMNMKINLHRSVGTDLVQTFTYQRQEGSLLENLESELSNRKVAFEPLPKNQIFDKLNEMGKVNSLASLLGTFLNLYDSSGETLDSLLSTVEPDDSRTRAFLKIFEYIHNDYLQLLREDRSIDFNQMINQATDLVEQYKYLSPFHYVLVDEFQDISQSLYRFLKALTTQNNARLFCVGDDWQSINRFAGSDLSIMTEFEKNFGDCEIRKIQQTHRFNNKLCDFSTKFILANRSQIHKTITSKTMADKPAVTLFKESTETALEKIIQQINQIATENDKVLIINRYTDIGRPQNLNELRWAYPKLNIEYRTAHKSKGRTVDFAIVIGLKSGEFGFPCQHEADPLLDLVKAKKEHFPHSEERRVFYVAITRARKHVYLIADSSYNPSDFVKEIENNGYEINVAGEGIEAISCPDCQGGTIVWKKNFERNECSNSPFCDYVPPKCPQCHDSPSVSQKEKGFLHLKQSHFVCSNNKCSFQAKPCPKCLTGCLLPKKDKNGRSFFGCSNFRPKNCRYTEDESQQSKYSRPSPVTRPVVRSHVRADVTIRLEGLKKLLDRDLITQQDYDQKREEILSQI